MISLVALWLLDMLMVFIAKILSFGAESVKTLHVLASPCIFAKEPYFPPDNDLVRSEALKGYIFLRVEAEVYFDSS